MLPDEGDGVLQRFHAAAGLALVADAHRHGEYGLRRAMGHVGVVAVDQLLDAVGGPEAEGLDLGEGEVREVGPDALELCAEGGLVHPAREGAPGYLGGLRGAREVRVSGDVRKGGGLSGSEDDRSCGWDIVRHFGTYLP